MATARACYSFSTGKRTHELAELRPGESLAVTGPLGNGFDLSSNPSHAAIVAGGVGIASVLLAAECLVRAGTHVSCSTARAPQSCSSTRSVL